MPLFILRFLLFYLLPPGAGLAPPEGLDPPAGRAAGVLGAGLERE